MSHVYWRINITAGQTVNPGIAEWVPKDGSGTIIPTTGGTASASSSYPGQPASNAFDGSASTFWLANGAAPQWLQYQFTSAVDIVSFTLTSPPSGVNAKNTPMDFQLQYSDDGSAWFTRYSYTGAGWGGSGGATLTFDASNQLVVSPAIWWRLDITAAGGAAAVSIAQWTLIDPGGNPFATATYSASATSTYNGDSACPYNAFDSNLATWWNSNAAPSGGSPQYLIYKFASLVTVNSFSIQARNDSLYTQSPTTFSLEYSFDGVNWVSVGSYTAAAWTGAGQVQTFGLSAPTPMPQALISVVT